MEIIGKKLGMTQVFTANGDLVAVTVVEAGPCTVLQKKTAENDGYSALQIGFGERDEKHATKPMLGHAKKAGVAAPRVVREIKIAGFDAKLGDKITVEHFKPGQFVDVIGLTKGKGFQGVVKRHRFRGGDASHGAKGFHRRPGAIGQRSFPGRVFKGMRMAGHMGNARRTTQNLKLVDVKPEKNLLLIAGALPGPTGNIVIVRHAKKKPLKP
jgi:large subunit ribosomal protein L3